MTCWKAIAIIFSLFLLSCKHSGELDEESFTKKDGSSSDRLKNLPKVKPIVDSTSTSQSFFAPDTPGHLEKISGSYAPSIEVRESVEFLLVPAILVQQSIRGDMVITYPVQ